jgi:hypothetical protein
MYNESYGDTPNTAEKSSSSDHPEYLAVSGFNADADGCGEDMYAAVDGEELTKCQSYRMTGRDCSDKKTETSEFCKKHTCGQKGCYKLKSSKTEYCKDHRTTGYIEVGSEGGGGEVGIAI